MQNKSKARLTEEQHNELEHLAFVTGVKGAAIGIGIGAVATLMTFRRSTHFRGLSTPAKAILPGSAGFAGYLFGADRAATRYANKKLGYVDDDIIRDLQSDANISEPGDTKQRVAHFVNKNRWKIIGGSWAFSMVGALGFTFSNRYLTTQQKLVQARMYAQAATIAVLLASAAVSIYTGEEDKNRKVDEPDEELRAVLNLPHQQSKAVRMPQPASPNEGA
ncbi:hypothetical protein BDB00DRAFT_798674 [Zychaea mexicana]|uniref:uncharacterized protein n=1 Tax=Zychaea mexicana TaxID=64656 RepID=UPI0022FF054B|nr:uncharacterized protein BDB00DRAFT_798674 [Zychaea mexicana]KAI9498614.1 hypothetical protein BDB00DRAFT_798674 [Zychaea mexicana]